MSTWRSRLNGNKPGPVSAAESPWVTVYDKPHKNIFLTLDLHWCSLKEQIWCLIQVQLQSRVGTWIQTPVWSVVSNKWRCETFNFEFLSSTNTLIKSRWTLLLLSKSRLCGYVPPQRTVPCVCGWRLRTLNRQRRRPSSSYQPKTSLVTYEALCGRLNVGMVEN